MSTIALASTGTARLGSDFDLASTESHCRRGQHPSHDDDHANSRPGGGRRRNHHPRDRLDCRQRRNRHAFGGPRRHPRPRRAAAGGIRGVGCVYAVIGRGDIRYRHGRPLLDLCRQEHRPYRHVSHPSRSGHHHHELLFRNRPSLPPARHPVGASPGAERWFAVHRHDPGFVRRLGAWQQQLTLCWGFCRSPEEDPDGRGGAERLRPSFF